MSQEKNRKRRAIARRDGERCAVCGTTRDLTIDHVIPKSRGGSNRIDNLQFLCQTHNQEKGDRVDEEARVGIAIRAALPTSRQSKKKRKGWPVPVHLPECDSQFCMVGCPAYPVLVANGVRVIRKEHA